MQVGTRMTRSSSARQASNAYLLSWVAVAAGGLAYLAVAGARPDLLSIILPISDQSQDQVIAGRTDPDVADELASLRKWVHDLQHEVAATRSALNDQLVETQVMAQRLAVAEDRLTPVREVRVEAAAKSPLQRLPVRPSAKTEPPRAALPAASPPQEVAAAPPSSGPAVKVINAETPSPIVTGSLPATSGKALGGFGQTKVVAAPPGRPRGILIGSSESLENLRARWAELSTSNAGDLRELTPRYRLATDGRQAPFALLAGPFGTNDDAQRTCANLKAKGVACRVSDYSGSAF